MNAKHSRRRSHRRFAILPIRLEDGRWIWLSFYRSRRIAMLDGGSYIERRKE
ncbi:hypothetical protein [Brevirhabdus pacifica]|uniref:hypothetical protein n=1 Tax=Brevirhabdus pacifica TaxID=1267768 RepID=UPI0012FD3915|nr:hypothetical protein [Brevirhabdus pacifica]